MSTEAGGLFSLCFWDLKRAGTIASDLYLPRACLAPVTSQRQDPAGGVMASGFGLMHIRSAFDFN